MLFFVFKSIQSCIYIYTVGLYTCIMCMSRPIYSLGSQMNNIPVCFIRFISYNLYLYYLKLFPLNTPVEKHFSFYQQLQQTVQLVLLYYWLQEYLRYLSECTRTSLNYLISIAFYTYFIKLCLSQRQLYCHCLCLIV